jgi:hypothetical protein
MVEHAGAPFLARSLREKWGLANDEAKCDGALRRDRASQPPNRKKSRASRGISHFLKLLVPSKGLELEPLSGRERSGSPLAKS